MTKKKIIIAITGASGSIYAVNLLEKLKAHKNNYEEIAVIFSETGKKVMQYETASIPALRKPFRFFSNNDLFAAPASGSAGYDEMVVCPCSMGTLARIAAGNAQTLIERAADVMMKERKKLILVTRETPLSLIHIRNMETVTLAGGMIMPASPSFYRKPETINDLTDSLTERIMNFILPEFKGYQWK
jgi:4-hydroxy-3-polyprenylbenzoate decarboxylase